MQKTTFPPKDANQNRGLSTTPRGNYRRRGRAGRFQEHRHVVELPISQDNFVSTARPTTSNSEQLTPVVDGSQSKNRGSASGYRGRGGRSRYGQKPFIKEASNLNSHPSDSTEKQTFAETDEIEARVKTREAEIIANALQRAKASGPIKFSEFHATGETKSRGGSPPPRDDEGVADYIKTLYKDNLENAKRIANREISDELIKEAEGTSGYDKTASSAKPAPSQVTSSFVDVSKSGVSSQRAKSPFQNKQQVINSPRQQAEKPMRLLSPLNTWTSSQEERLKHAQKLLSNPEAEKRSLAITLKVHGERANYALQKGHQQNPVDLKILSCFGNLYNDAQQVGDQYVLQKLNEFKTQNPRLMEELSLAQPSTGRAENTFVSSLGSNNSFQDREATVDSEFVANYFTQRPILQQNKISNSTQGISSAFPPQGPRSLPEPIHWLPKHLERLASAEQLMRNSDPAKTLIGKSQRLRIYGERVAHLLKSNQEPTQEELKILSEYKQVYDLAGSKHDYDTSRRLNDFRRNNPDLFTFLEARSIVPKKF